MARGVAAQVAACPRAPGRVAGWARGRATMPTTDAGAEGVAAVRRSWPCKVRPRRAWPWRGVVAELRHAAVRRQADNTCSRGGRDGQRRAACTWTWRIEERGHRDLGGGGYPACARRASQGAVQAPWLGVATWHRMGRLVGVSRGRSWRDHTAAGGRCKPLACSDGGPQRASLLSTARPVSPVGSWKFLENPHWSKLRSAERRVCLLHVIVDC